MKNTCKRPELILFTGIPASGKTTFYMERFFPSHVYISLDQVKSRSAENELLAFCMNRQRDCVVDNTNVRRIDRSRYIAMAKANGFRVIGYCFVTPKEDALARNAKRIGKACVRDAAIMTMYKELEYPKMDEGYEELNYVTIEDGGFKVEAYDEKRIRR